MAAIFQTIFSNASSRETVCIYYKVIEMSFKQSNCRETQESSRVWLWQMGKGVALLMALHIMIHETNIGYVHSMGPSDAYMRR